MHLPLPFLALAPPHSRAPVGRRELHAQYPRDACCSRKPPLPHRSRHATRPRCLPSLAPAPLASHSKQACRRMTLPGRLRHTPNDRRTRAPRSGSPDTSKPSPTSACAAFCVRQVSKGSMHRAAILSVLAAVAISSVASDHEVHETVTKIGVDHPAVAFAQAALPGADFCFGYLESKARRGRSRKLSSKSSS